jgi:xanthine dehydrogenase accessory factor
VNGEVDVLRQAAAWLDAGRGVALATVLSTWGSSPRPAGSLLAVNDRLELAGSVSGGCVEGAVAEAAGEVIRGAPVRRLRFGVSDGRAWEVGLACGGTVEILVARADRALLGRLLEAAAARRPAVVVTDLATGAAEVLDPQAPAAHPRAAAAAESSALDTSRIVDGPGGQAFLGVLNPPVRVLIVGAVHVAQALAPMVRLAGPDVVVVDPRTAFATEARFPGIRLLHAWPEEALAAEGLDRRTAVITLTHDPKLDDPALAAALRSEAFYVGALGSRRTQAARRERLAAQGFAPAALDRIHGPVGLAIGAVAPGEIAASILAELVSVLRRGASPLGARETGGGTAQGGERRGW